MKKGSLLKTTPCEKNREKTKEKEPAPKKKTKKRLDHVPYGDFFRLRRAESDDDKAVFHELTTSLRGQQAGPPLNQVLYPMRRGGVGVARWV